jgi:hypothetical protein
VDRQRPLETLDELGPTLLLEDASGLVVEPALLPEVVSAASRADEEEVDEEILADTPPPSLPEVVSAASGADEEDVDEEIRADTPPVLDSPDTEEPLSLARGALPVSRFATPPLVFHRARPAIPTRPQVAPARPRTLGEFLAAAKSRSDALMQTPAVRRRLLALNFQPRRSSRIAGQPGGMNMEMKAVRNLMRKLGLITGDEAPSEAALEAYHRMFELPMTDDMIEAIAELYGWTLDTIRGCSPPLLGVSGGRLIAA